MPKQPVPLKILLAEDDTDDYLFFASALKGIPIATHLTIAKDGVQLMNYLNENSENLPHILFLDLSMPLRSGFECLHEIREDKKLEGLTVVVFTISFTNSSNFEMELKNILERLGAQSFIRKSSDLGQLKLHINNVLIGMTEKKSLYGYGRSL